MQWAGEHFTKVDGEGAGGDEQGGVQGRGSSSPEARGGCGGDRHAEGLDGRVEEAGLTAVVMERCRGGPHPQE